MRDYRRTDPELVAIVEAFAYGELPSGLGQELPVRDCQLAILSSLMGTGSTELFSIELERALDEGLEALSGREVVYQGNDYIGMGRTLPFLDALNDVLTKRGVSLPLEEAATSDASTRLEKGAQAQATIFGPQMLEAWKAGPVNRFLASNCFGDYYTRRGLTLRERELVTFCLLASQGGCEPQLVSHAKGNMNMGNDAPYLRSVVIRILPYIGYPRSLNALSAIEKAGA